LTVVVRADAGRTIEALGARAAGRPASSQPGRAASVAVTPAAAGAARVRSNAHGVLSNFFTGTPVVTALNSIASLAALSVETSNPLIVASCYRLPCASRAPTSVSSGQRGG
jgi:hypothetical protein